MLIPEFQTITNSSVVCSLHFKPEDFHTTKSRRALNAYAVPSFFPVMACVVSGVLFLGWTPCPRAPALAPSAAGVALACGTASTLLFGGVVLDLPLKAPQPYLLTDIVVSTVMGLLLLVTAVLSMTVCEFYSLVSYLQGPLVVLNAGMVIGSAVITYVAVMRLWDTARPPCPPDEHEV